LFFSTAERQRPYLMTRVQGTNDYINAAFLDVSVYILIYALFLKKQFQAFLAVTGNTDDHFKSIC